MNRGIGDLTDAMAGIADGMSELSTGGRQIMNALSSLVSVTEKVREGSVETNRKLTDVRTAMDEMSAEAQDGTTSTEKAGQIMGEVSSSVEELLDQGRANARQILGIDRKLAELDDKRSGDIFVLGYNDVPPYCMTENRNATGAATEFATALLMEMGVTKIKFRRIQQLERIYELIDRGEVDAYPLGNEGMEVNGRLGRYELGRPSTIVTRPGFIVPNTLTLREIRDTDDIRDLRIGTKTGMPLMPSLEPMRDSIKWFGGLEPLQEAIQEMHKGRLDAVYSPLVGELVYMTLGFGMAQDYRELYLPDSSIELTTVFSQRAWDTYGAAYQDAYRSVSGRGSFDDRLNRYLKK
jgi:hypothetical protein